MLNNPDNWNESGAPVNPGDTVQFTGIGTTHTVDFRDSFF